MTIRLIIIIPVDYIITAERIAVSDVDTAYKGQLTIRRGDLEDAGPSDRGATFSGHTVRPPAGKVHKGLSPQTTESSKACLPA